MTEPAATPPPSGQSRRMLTDIGPLLAFFVVNYIWGLMAGTAVLVLATLAALCLAYLWERRLALMPAVGCLFVVIFGGLTLAFDDAFFIKIKPTVVNVMLAAALAIGLALRRLWLRHIMGAFIQVSETGWRYLTWAWIGFFLALAAANEMVWRHFTTDQWVTFKAFGIPIAAVAFSVALSPILRRHVAAPEE